MIRELTPDLVDDYLRFFDHEAFAEAYPARQPRSDAAAYHGPLQMYLDAGFTPYREPEQFVIVRRPLTADDER